MTQPAVYFNYQSVFKYGKLYYVSLLVFRWCYVCSFFCFTFTTCKICPRLATNFYIKALLCWIYIRVCDMSKTNVAISTTNCSLSATYRQHVYDKFLETERRRFQMCLRQCLQFIFSANKNFFELKKNFY